MVPAGSTDLVLDALTYLRLQVDREGRPATQPRILLYFPSVKKAFRIELSVEFPLRTLPSEGGLCLDTPAVDELIYFFREEVAKNTNAFELRKLKAGGVKEGC